MHLFDLLYIYINNDNINEYLNNIIILIKNLPNKYHLIYAL